MILKRDFTIGGYTEESELQTLGTKLVRENLNGIRNDETLPIFRTLVLGPHVV